jgi:hypothetical protein
LFEHREVVADGPVLDDLAVLDAEDVQLGPTLSAINGASPQPASARRYVFTTTPDVSGLVSTRASSDVVKPSEKSFFPEPDGVPSLVELR